LIDLSADDFDLLLLCVDEELERKTLTDRDRQTDRQTDDDDNLMNDE